MADVTDRVGAPGLAIEPMAPDDGPSVLAIFQEGLATGTATLESTAPDWPTFDADHLPEPRLVARLDGEVVAWTALSSVSDRCAYAGVAWESVYVAAAARGRGVGRAILETMVAASEAAGLWTLQAGILVENAASLALHERCGFRIVGVRERMGVDGEGRWRDVVLMERRSPTVGVGVPDSSSSASDSGSSAS